MASPPPQPEPLTTNDLIIRTVLGLIVFIVVLYASALFLGRTVLPPGVLEGITPYILPLLISAIGAMTYALNQRQQKKVEVLVAEVRDGLGTKIAAGINSNNETIAAALEAKREADAKALAMLVDQAAKASAADLLLINARREADRIVMDARAQAQREHLAEQVAAIPGQIAQIPNITNPVTQAAAPGVAAEIQANTAQLSEATAATAENTSATMADTQVRLTALETAAAETPPKEGT